jgi:signal transduction histidine kinase
VARTRLRASLGYSQRARLFVALLLTGIAPQAFVFAFSLLERPVAGRLLRETHAALDEAQRAASQPNPKEALREIAERHRARVRLIDHERRVVFDADFDREPDNLMRTIERFFVITATADEISGAEYHRGPPPGRLEFHVAMGRGEFVDCDLEAFVFCQGTHKLQGPSTALAVHVQKISLRAVGPVYALRRRMLRLTVFTVPLSIIVAYYLARRLHRPLAALRDATLQKALAAHAVADLPEGDDEVGQVGQSVNTLLNALDERRKATSAFMDDLVHEVKNPVAAIKAAAESLEKGASNPERSQRIARIVLESTGKLDRLVTELLDLSRAEAGMRGEDRSTFDLGALVRGVVQSTHADVRFAALAFEVVPEAPVGPLLVHGVPARLESVARELVMNAASFCGEGGKVTVTLSDKAKHVEFEVCDTGPGIEAQALPHVFDRFFTTRAREQGTGLGLAMVKAVVEAHDGDVTVASEPGKGAAFRVRFPRPAQEATESS